jgi:hypothetical protein
MIEGEFLVALLVPIQANDEIGIRSLWSPMVQGPQVRKLRKSYLSSKVNPLEAAYSDHVLALMIPSNDMRQYRKVFSRSGWSEFTRGWFTRLF